MKRAGKDAPLAMWNHLIAKLPSTTRASSSIDGERGYGIRLRGWTSLA